MPTSRLSTPSSAALEIALSQRLRRPRRARAWALLLIACLLVATLTSCGTAGPAGPIGPPGTDGSDGQDGRDGEDGAANVIYSEWIPFETATWSGPVSAFGFVERRYDVVVPALDDAFLDQGLIFVYLRIAGIAGQTFMLPHLGPFTQTQDQMLEHRSSVGRIRLAFFNVSDRTVDPGTFGPANAFRYVLVPGGVPAATALALDPSVDDGVVIARTRVAPPARRTGR